MLLINYDLHLEICQSRIKWDGNIGALFLYRVSVINNSENECLVIITLNNSSFQHIVYVVACFELSFTFIGEKVLMCVHMKEYSSLTM